MKKYTYRVRKANYAVGMFLITRSPFGSHEIADFYLDKSGSLGDYAFSNKYDLFCYNTEREAIQTLKKFTKGIYAKKKRLIVLSFIL